MWVFRYIEGVGANGFHWSPKIEIVCPHCGETVSFCTQLRLNQCTACSKVMPFESIMANDQQKRVEYHVHNDTEGDP